MKQLAMITALVFALIAPGLSGRTAATEAPTEPELVDIAGIVAEMADNTLTLDTESHGQVIVHLTDETVFEGDEPAVDAYVHILHNGAMTMSIPPQLTAVRVGCYAFRGVVESIDEDFFTLVGENDTYRVNAEPEKLALLSAGQTVTVYSNGMMTMSIPAQIYGEYIVP